MIATQPEKKLSKYARELIKELEEFLQLADQDPSIDPAKREEAIRVIEAIKRADYEMNDREEQLLAVFLLQQYQKREARSQAMKIWENLGTILMYIFCVSIGWIACWIWMH